MEPRKAIREITEHFNSVARRIEDLPELSRLALAVAITQRLMDEYLLQREDRRSTFVGPWLDAMPLLWRALTHPSAELKRTLETRLTKFVEEFFGEEPPEYGQPRYSQDAAYACIDAIEAYCYGNSKAATAVASLLLDDAQRRQLRTSAEIGEDPMSSNADARRLRLQHIELDRVGRAVSLLEREGFSVGVLPQLTALLAAEEEEGTKSPRNRQQEIARNRQQTELFEILSPFASASCISELTG